MLSDFSILVPAAGLGSRMKNGKIPKALTPFAGKNLMSWAISAFDTTAQSIVVVIRSEHSPYFSIARNSIRNKNVEFVVQNDPTGTADAISIGLNKMDTEWTLVIWADHIGASQMKPNDLLQHCNNPETDFVLPLVECQNPYVYFGDSTGQTLAFNETRFGAPKIESGISDCGIFLFRTRKMINFFKNYAHFRTTMTTRDVNFLSLFVDMQNSGLKFEQVFFQNKLLAKGVNSRSELLAMLNLFG